MWSPICDIFDTFVTSTVTETVFMTTDYDEQDVTKMNPLIDHRIDEKTKMEKVFEYLIAM